MLLKKERKLLHLKTAVKADLSSLPKRDHYTFFLVVRYWHFTILHKIWYWRGQLVQTSCFSEEFVEIKSNKTHKNKSNNNKPNQKIHPNFSLKNHVIFPDVNLWTFFLLAKNAWISFVCIGGPACILQL